YFSNNRIRNEAYLKNGMMDSIEKSYDSVTGKLVREAYYKDRILNGLYKEFFPDGKLSFRASFKEGKPDDTCTAFYENGKLEYAEKFKDGKKEGTFIKWYPNGRMKMVIGYRDDIQVLSKVCFDEDGRLIPSYGMILRKNTKDTIALEESFKVDIGDINYDPSKPIAQRDVVRVFMGDLNEDDSLINATGATELPIIGGRYATYSVTPTDTGEHHYSGIMQYTKSDGVKVRAPFRGSFYVKVK